MRGDARLSPWNGYAGGEFIFACVFFISELSKISNETKLYYRGLVETSSIRKLKKKEN